MKLELVAPSALGAQPEVKPRSEEYEKLQTGWETMAALLLVVSQHEKSCSSTQQCERRVWYCFYILDHFVWWHLKCNQPFKEMKFSKRSARITSCGSPITNLQCSIRKLLQHSAVWEQCLNQLWESFQFGTSALKMSLTRRWFFSIFYNSGNDIGTFRQVLAPVTTPTVLKQWK